MEDVRAVGPACATRKLRATGPPGLDGLLRRKIRFELRAAGVVGDGMEGDRFGGSQACSRMIFMRRPSSDPSIAIAVFNSPSGMTWLTRGSRRTIPRCTRAIEFG